MKLLSMSLLRIAFVLAAGLCNWGAAFAADITPPTVSIVLSDYALKIGETATVTLTFSEAVTGFTLDALSTHKAVFSNLTDLGNGTIWTATLTPNANTKYQSKVSADLTSVSDLAGNAGVDLIDSANYVVDNVAPVVTTAGFILLDTALKIGDTTTVQIHFSEKVSPFTAADLTADNATVTDLTTPDDGQTWTATLTPNNNASSATNAVTLDMTGIVDLAGNAGSGTSSSINYAVDTLRPALASTIALSDSALRIGETSVVTFTFAEAVTDFTLADISAQSGDMSNLNSADGDITWTATLTPSATTTADANKITLTLTGVTDLAGNAGTGAADSGSYGVDTVRPAISGAITLSDSALTVGETATLTITFTEAVPALSKDDITVQNGALTNLTTSDLGMTWTATLTPTALVTDATNVVTVNLATLTDAAGNAGTATQDSGNYTVNTVPPDTTPPTLAITMSDEALKIGETSTVTFTFSEAVTGFANADVSVQNGTLSPLATTDNKIFTATFTPAATTTDNSNTISVAMTDLQDVASNAGVGSSSGPNYKVDTMRPALLGTIAMSTTTLTNDQTLTLTYTFSEPVADFTTADLTAQNGILSDLMTTDNGTTWKVTLTPNTPISDPSNVVTLNLATLSDDAGNAGTGTQNSDNYSIETTAPDITPPTLAITLSDSALAPGETATVTFTFSEAVTGFANSGITVANGTLDPVQTTDNITFTATFAPAATTTDNSNTILVTMSGVTDVAGNAGVGSQNSPNYSVDTASHPQTSPIITPPLGDAGDATSNVTVDETTTAVGQFLADVAVTWSITDGADMGYFAIDANGNLAFNSVPDFENPSDSGQDNIYVVTLTATDIQRASANHTVYVTVSDQDETQGGGTRALSDVLAKDLARNLSEQQDRADQITQGALERLHQGATAPCGVIKQADVTGPFVVQNGEIAPKGSFAGEVNDCAKGQRRITTGDFAFSLLAGQGTALSFNYDQQTERFASADELRGQFWGGYLRGANIDADAALGRILGFGMRAGLYGAQRLTDRLTFDYHEAMTAGYNSFDLDIAKGGYGYGAVFGSAALSGEYQMQGLTLSPRFGTEFGLGFASDAQGVDGLSIPRAKTARVFVEMLLAKPLESEALGQLHSKLTLAPRLYCDVLGGDTTCSFGGAIAFRRQDKSTGMTFVGAFQTERLAGQDKVTLNLAAQRAVLNHQGTIAFGMSVDNAQEVKLSQNLEIKF